MVRELRRRDDEPLVFHSLATDGTKSGHGAWNGSLGLL